MTVTISITTAEYDDQPVCTSFTVDDDKSTIESVISTHIFAVINCHHTYKYKVELRDDALVLNSRHEYMKVTFPPAYRSFVSGIVDEIKMYQRRSRLEYLNTLRVKTLAKIQEIDDEILTLGAGSLSL